MQSIEVTIGGQTKVLDLYTKGTPVKGLKKSQIDAIKAKVEEVGRMNELQRDVMAHPTTTISAKKIDLAESKVTDLRVGDTNHDNEDHYSNALRNMMGNIYLIIQNPNRFEDDDETVAAIEGGRDPAAIEGDSDADDAGSGYTTADDAAQSPLYSPSLSQTASFAGSDTLGARSQPFGTHQTVSDRSADSGQISRVGSFSDLDVLFSPADEAAARYFDPLHAVPLEAPAVATSTTSFPPAAPFNAEAARLDFSFNSPPHSLFSSRCSSPPPEATSRELHVDTHPPRAEVEAAVAALAAEQAREAESRRATSSTGALAPAADTPPVTPPRGVVEVDDQQEPLGVPIGKLRFVRLDPESNGLPLNSAQPPVSEGDWKARVGSALSWAYNHRHAKKVAVAGGTLAVRGAFAYAFGF